MSSIILRQNQVPEERIKQQKREWYYRNKKSVLKQQKKSDERKESKREWYEKNKSMCIQNATKWKKENPEKLKLHIQKYVQKNSAQTRYWKPYNIPTESKLKWIKNFGQLPKYFSPKMGKLSLRLTLEIADLKDSNLIIIHHHYLHRSRKMRQLPYWICIDKVRVGVMSYSLPRVTNPVDGIEPMKLLELARLWIHPSVQNLTTEDRYGKTPLSVTSCAMEKSIKRVQRDWHLKYPNLPKIDAVISWSDDKRHRVKIYKSSNFKVTGKSGRNSLSAGKI